MYWKRYDNVYRNFNDAHKLWKELHDQFLKPAIKVENGDYRQIMIDNESMSDNIDNIELPLWAVRSQNWEVLVPDEDKNKKAIEIVDWICDELDFEPDSRFFDVDKMKISDWWNELNDHFINEDIAFEIMLWLKEKKLLHKK